MKRDPLVYVDNIEEALDRIERWTATGRDAFMSDEMKQAAVARKLHELSESMQRLEPLVGLRYPEVPWSQIIAFRNVVVHGYLGLDLQIVWSIVTEHLPALKPHIEKMRAEL